MIPITYFVGLDIGSTATKSAAVDMDGTVVGSNVIDLGAGTRSDGRALLALRQDPHLDSGKCEYIVATGYGRRICESANAQVSEIICHARGVYHLLPHIRTIIDIGGQDLKVIQISGTGMVRQFIMNDKCAAGTGRFLEVMSRVMGIGLSELGTYDGQAAEIQPISSTCSVFAESEVISKMASGTAIPNIVAGVHDSVARKIVGLAKRIGIVPPVALTGGGAMNTGVVRALARCLEQDIATPQEPQLTGALGAALIARDKWLAGQTKNQGAEA